MTPDLVNWTGAPAGCYSKAHSLGKAQPNYTSVTKHSGVIRHFPALCPYLETNEIEAVLGYSVKQKRKYSQLGTKCKAKRFTAEEKGHRKTERSFTDEK